MSRTYCSCWRLVLLALGFWVHVSNALVKPYSSLLRNSYRLRGITQEFHGRKMDDIRANDYEKKSLALHAFGGSFSPFGGDNFGSLFDEIFGQLLGDNEASFSAANNGEIAKLEKNLNTKISKARSTYGADAVDRVVKDPIWKDPSSTAFKSKYGKHALPWVRDLASLKQNILKLKQQSQRQMRSSFNVVQLMPDGSMQVLNGGDGDGLGSMTGGSTSYESARKFALDALGEAFVADILADPDWINVESDAFQKKFLDHAMPAVSRMAAAYKEEREMSDSESDDSDSESDNSDDSGVREKIVAKEVSKTPDSAQFTDAALASNYWQWFHLFSSPDSTSWDSRKEMLSHSPARALTAGSLSGNYASSSIPLPNNRPSTWNVRAELTGSELTIGVIPTSVLLTDQFVPKKAADTSSPYDVSRSIGWGPANKVYTLQGPVSDPEWPGWQTGDKGQFTYDPVANKLSLYLQRNNKTYTIDTDPNQRVHLHTFMKGNAALKFSFN